MNTPCKFCDHWEPDKQDCMGNELPAAPIGYCPMFIKMTKPDHGQLCTAWTPLVVSNGGFGGDPGLQAALTPQETDAKRPKSA